MARSTFNVSFKRLHTGMANLVHPFHWRFLYPGQIIKSRTRVFARLSNPLQYPLMDDIRITIHWFAAPLRILWDNFRKFWGERENPGDSIDYTVPTLSTGTINTLTADRIHNDLGIRFHTAVDGTDIGALAHRCYCSIWDYWYRDSGIQDATGFPKNDGPDTAFTYVLKNRGKRFDYFTGGKTAPQRGESTTIGGEIAHNAPDGSHVAVYSDVNSATRKLDSDGPQVDASAVAGSSAYYLYPNTTINELRNAAAIQQFLERDNRTGQRFGDIIEAHYGHKFLDTKYAPAYVAGGSGFVNVSPIYNASKDSGATGSEQPLGELGAIGVGTFEGAAFTYIASEPEILMGMWTVDSKPMYHQGLNRNFSRRTRYDFLWPEFQGIGDQATISKEIYHNMDANDEDVLQYNPRFEDERQGIDTLGGMFASDWSAPIDEWHVAQDFVGRPTFNTTFIENSVPMGRVLQNNVPDHMLLDIQVSMHSTLPISRTGVPGLARL